MYPFGFQVYRVSKKAEAPCKDCQDRKPGCHSKCEKYASYKEKRKKENDVIESNKGKDMDYFSYISGYEDRNRKDQDRKTNKKRRL